MADDDVLNTAGHESDVPDSDTPDLSDANDGDGATEHDQSEGGADDSANDTLPDSDNSTHDDDDQDSVLDALANGTMDELDSEGNPKPKEEAKKDDEPAKSDEDKAKEEAAAKAKAEADDLTPEEKAELAKTTKGTRKIAQRLFAERKELRTQIQAKDKEIADKVAEVETYRPAKTFADNIIQDLHKAGLVTKKADGKLDYKGFVNLLNVERSLQGKKPGEIAAYYRGLADKIDPSSRPVKLAQDLSDQVVGEVLTQEEAEHIQRLRDEKANPPKSDDRQEDPEETEQETARVQQERLAAREKAEDAALGEIKGVFDGCATRYGTEWPAIKAQVLESLKPLVKDASPRLWKQLAEQQIRLIIAERRPVLKKPTPTPQANGGKTKSNRTLTEAEEAEALASGKLT